MPAARELSIITVSFNTEKLTVATIESVVADLEKEKKLAATTEIITVDNASSDGSVAAMKKLAKQHSQLTIIEHDKNSGFAAANNLGLEKASGEFVLLLNSDTLMLNEQGSESQLALLLAQARMALDQGIGILSPTLRNPDGSLQPQGGHFPTLFSLMNHMLMFDDIPVIGQWLPSTQHTGLRSEASSAGHQELIHQDWIGGTAMLIARPVIDAIGGLDDGIFMYAEDVEYCYRAAKAGWGSAITPAVSILHYGSASSSSTRAITGELQGFEYFWHKHRPAWQRPLARTLIWLGIHLRLVIFGTMNRVAAVETYRQAKKALFS
jgi:GT2 family glycosyltransferase